MVDSRPTETVSNIDDDRPIALRRKRRSSAIQPNSSRSATTEVKEENVIEVRLSPASKPSKRVRFSDPGSEVGTSSTGLTPSIKRTSLAPSRSSSPTPSRSRAKGATRRTSLPVTTPADAPLSSEVQFAPLRQVLDDRLKRRLRRNHLSEEVNDIDAKKRRLTRASQEAEDLEHEIRDRDETVQELDYRLELAKQPEHGLSERRAGLEEVGPETRQLERAPVRPRSQPKAAKAPQDAPLAPDLDIMVVDENSFDNGGVEDDDLEEFMMVNYRNTDDTADSNTHPPTSKSAIEFAEADANVQTSLPNPAHEREVHLLRTTLKSSTAALENATNHQHRLLTKLQPFIATSTDDGIGDGAPLDNALDHVLTTLALTQSRADDASATLHALSADIAALGFEGESAQEMLKNLTEVFRKARLDLEYLAPGETVGGFQNGKLVSTLVDRVRGLMWRLRDGEKDLSNQKQQEANLRQQFHGALLKMETTRTVIQELTEKLDGVNDELKHADARIQELEIDVDERDRSVAKLQHALEGYREEVKGLEDLINTMETNHHTATTQHRDEMSKSIAEVKQQVGTEMELRHQAEEETRQYHERADQLAEALSQAQQKTDHLRAEITTQLSAKEEALATLQQSLLEREQQHHDNIATRDAQLSSLRDEIITLHSSLNEAQSSIEILKTAKVNLEGRLEEEAAYGTCAVDKMQAEMMRSLARMGEVKNSYLRGAKLRSVNGRHEEDTEGEERGPLTPNSVVRFADVLVAKEGKARMYDSDLGYLEEDTEEEAAGSEL
ncbi:MAG: hypothetical protein M1835_001904 [Candelina submexicana]|nr:MAG: hypothetical protein M1835_001904 [Candelina submexicana]